MGRIRVAIAGVGNCASSLVQDINYDDGSLRQMYDEAAYREVERFIRNGNAEPDAGDGGRPDRGDGDGRIGARGAGIDDGEHESEGEGQAR